MLFMRSIISGCCRSPSSSLASVAVIFFFTVFSFVIPTVFRQVAEFVHFILQLAAFFSPTFNHARAARWDSAPYLIHSRFGGRGWAAPRRGPVLRTMLVPSAAREMLRDPSAAPWDTSPHLPERVVNWITGPFK